MLDHEHDMQKECWYNISGEFELSGYNLFFRDHSGMGYLLGGGCSCSFFPFFS